MRDNRLSFKGGRQVLAERPGEAGCVQACLLQVNVLPEEGSQATTAIRAYM